MRIFLSSLSLFILLLLTSGGCNGKKQKEESSASPKDASIEVKYAQAFSIEKLPQGHRVKIFDPSTGTLLQNLLLLSEEESLSYTPSEGEEVISVPCKRLALLSDTFVGAIEKLDARDPLVATSDVSTLYDPELRQKAQMGQLHSVARSGVTDFESLISLQVDVAILSYYQGIAQSIHLPKAAPTKVIYNMDWQESSLLARAEWIKVIALLVGKEEVARTLFDEMEQKYHLLCEQAATAKEKPRVFFGNTYQGTWHLPAIDSYVARMIEDAGGVYDAPKGDAASSGISFESVLQEHAQDDIWLAWQVGNIQTLEDFAKYEKRYPLFKAYKQGKVYLNDARSTPKGNDYFERGPYEPEVILADLITIFHPELLSDHQALVYWRQLPSSMQP